MTKTALEAKKMKLQHELQDRDHKWKESENKKDRRVKYVEIAAKTLGQAAGMAANDPQWYKRYITDLEKFTNVPTYRRLGTVWNKDAYASYAWNSTYQNAIPGVMVYHYVDTIGSQSNDPKEQSNNPVNQILMRTKEQVLKSNSRSSVHWEAADLGLNLFGTASIVTALGEYRRLIEVAQTFSAQNRYLNEGLLHSLGIHDADKFITELAQHRKNYVTLAKRFNNAIVAPADLSLFMRKWYLATNVFADSYDVSRPQMYAFKTQTYYRLSEDGSQLNMIGPMPLVDSSASAIYDFISSMFTAIVENADFQEMYADLRSAFGSRLLTISEDLSGDSTIKLNTDPLNREQIRNIKTLPVFYFEEGWNTCEANIFHIVSDDTGYLFQGSKSASAISRKFTLDCVSNANALQALPIIQLDYDSESSRQEIYSVEDINKCNGDTVLEITRFKFTCETGVKTYNEFIEIEPTSCGTEVVVYADMTTFSNSGAQIISRSIGTTALVCKDVLGDADSEMFYIMQPLSMISTFDWHPNVRLHNYSQVTPALMFNVLTFGDMTNSFPIAHSDLISINQICVLSELYINTESFKR